MATVKKDSKEWFEARDILWFLVFSGFAVNYMIRINLNIAIVSMIRQQPKNDLSNLVNSTESLLVSRQALLAPNLTEANVTTEVTGINSTIEDGDSRTFLWNEYHQGLILGAFFWFHWLTQIPGGILSKKYGTKLMFGLPNFLGSLCSFAIPIAAYWGHEYLIFVRAFQGFILGVTWPAMHNMAAHWIPPNERSRFVTAYLGSSVGAALTYPMCGWIIDWWNWELVFYISGLLGTIWYILWYVIVFDSPAEHPRISQKEKDYILSSIGQSIAKEKLPVPWKELIISGPLWMNILAQWGGVWGLFTLLTYGPMYFKVIHHLDIKATGLLSGVPHVFRTVFALGFSQLGDYLLTTNKLSRTNVRKLATFMCCIVQGVFMLGLAYSGRSYVFAVICLTTATTVNGAVSTGPLASVVDISPNYASIALGICNTIVAMVGYIMPLVVSYFTYENQTVDQWQKVFWIATLMLAVSGALYIVFSSSELQSWNTPKARIDDEVRDGEMQTLKESAASETREEKCNVGNGKYLSISSEEVKASDKN